VCKSYALLCRSGLHCLSTAAMMCCSALLAGDFEGIISRVSILELLAKHGSEEGEIDLTEKVCAAMMMQATMRACSLGVCLDLV